MMSKHYISESMHHLRASLQFRKHVVTRLHLGELGHLCAAYPIVKAYIRDSEDHIRQ